MLFIISDIKQSDPLLFSRVLQYPRLIHYLLQAIILWYSKRCKMRITYHFFMLYFVLHLLFERYE